MLSANGKGIRMSRVLIPEMEKGEFNCTPVNCGNARE